MKNTKANHPLTALCPLDGRYSQIANQLSDTFSEYALIKYRVFIETSWLKTYLCLTTDIPSFLPKDATDQIKAFGGYDQVAKFLDYISSHFTVRDAKIVKELERVTNHDVKACELFVAQKLNDTGLDALQSFVHICCTSEDITNLAYALMLIDGRKLLKQSLDDVIAKLRELTIREATTPMLSHTHGQPATPTTFGKEMGVFLHRLESQAKNIMDVKIYGKFNGASGNYAAGVAAFPFHRWGSISRSFISSLNPELNQIAFTTQIEPHDYVARLLNEIKVAMQIIRDLDQDMWSYISRGYLTQKVVATEVGSSTMPQKVNPITFENSESNIKILTGLCNSLADELPRSRMQRDLSDSSLLRNLGLVFGYAIQALSQTLKGLNKISVNTDTIFDDFNAHPEVVAEAIQTTLRRRGVADAYDRLKDFTRGKTIDSTDLVNFIYHQPELEIKDRERLSELCLAPHTYVGLSKNLALAAAGEIDLDGYLIRLSDH